MGWPELDMEEEKHTTDEGGDTLQHAYIPSRKSRETQGSRRIIHL
jgi:hypothetical protein